MDRRCVFCFTLYEKIWGGRVLTAVLNAMGITTSHTHPLFRAYVLGLRNHRLPSSNRHGTQRGCTKEKKACAAFSTRQHGCYYLRHSPNNNRNRRHDSTYMTLNLQTLNPNAIGTLCVFDIHPHLLQIAGPFTSRRLNPKPQFRVQGALNLTPISQIP